MMDALKFIEERNRMCDYYGGGNEPSECAKCPASQRKCLSVRSVTAEYIADVEQWAQKHPHKTRQDVFLEQYPETSIDEFGVLGVCPFLISTSHRGAHGGCAHVDVNCPDCRREFWLREAE